MAVPLSATRGGAWYQTAQAQAQNGKKLVNRALNLLIPLEEPINKTNNLQVTEPCERGKPAEAQVRRQAVSSSDRPRRTAAIVGELRRKDNL